MTKKYPYFILYIFYPKNTRQIDIRTTAKKSIYQLRSRNLGINHKYISSDQVTDSDMVLIMKYSAFTIFFTSKRVLQ